MAKRRKKGSKTGQVKQFQLDFWQKFEQDENIQKSIKFLLFGLDTTDIWTISRDTIIQDILNIFDKKTDIPLEIPFIAFITIWSGWLCHKKVYAKFGSTTLYPDIWTVLLSSSGSGKTFTLKQISNVINCPRIANINTSATFIKNLSENERGYIVKDEFAEFLKQMETQTYMQELKEYLLQIYSNESIVRQTKKETITVKEPIVSLLGTTVMDAFIENIKPIWLLDGFLQRFSLLVSQKPQKDLWDYLIYDVDLTPISKQIQEIQSKIKDQYVITETFGKILKGTFKNELIDLDVSFIRRIIFRIAKYSLIFHTLIDPQNDEIGIDSIVKAISLGKRHIIDLKSVLNHFGMSELEKKVRLVESLKEKLGRVPTPREIIRHVNSIKTALEAQAILKLLS